MAKLEEAIAGTRRWEHWERDGYRLIVAEGCVRMEKAGSDGIHRSEFWFPMDGWTRVVEMVSCPLCQGKGKVEKGRDYTVTRDGTYSFPNTYRT